MLNLFHEMFLRLGEILGPINKGLPLIVDNIVEVKFCKWESFHGEEPQIFHAMFFAIPPNISPDL